jgi:hypothetical protein
MNFVSSRGVVLAGSVPQPGCKILVAALLVFQLSNVIASEQHKHMLLDLEQVEGVQMGIFVGNELEPSLIVHVKEAKPGFERRGFFRIGLLPVEVVSGVVFEFQRSGAVSNCLAECPEAVFTRNGRRIELRDIQIVVHGSTTTRLSCAQIKPLHDGRLELIGPVLLESGTKRIVAPWAFLQTRGAQAGDVVMGKSPPSRANLCSVSPLGSEGAGTIKEKQ